MSRRLLGGRRRRRRRRAVVCAINEFPISVYDTDG